VKRRVLVAGAFIAILAVLVGVLRIILAPPQPSSTTPPAIPSHTLDPSFWQNYTARFVTAEGRVIDRDNNNVSHTEGQGFGMLLAEAADDRAKFDLIWSWTRAHLRRQDGLFSWRFGPCGTAGDCVTDTNNATDGDILIAWALLRAADRWRETAYTDSARNIAEAVAQNLIVSAGSRTLLLPGATGFQSGNTIVINPSYWVFPAFQLFAARFGDPLWRSLADSGDALIKDGRFGRWRLPADWITVSDGSLRLADGHPAHYGYDAVRVPLYLVWAGHAPADLLTPFLSFWGSFPADTTPAWVDLTDDQVAPYAWPTGMRAIATLVRRQSSGRAPDELPAPGADDGYYSSSLALLARIADRERPR
jgi:endoglucanase